jgi:4-amino-4-deoxy-L-arabinose transferase-like glycosyltransferase
MRLLSAVPVPLRVLLGAVAILVAAWALVPAPWQSPDESWHFAYAQTLAERGKLPDSDRQQSFSTEQDLASRYSRAGLMPFNLPLRAPWSGAQFASWQRADGRLPGGAASDGGGTNNAASNPPVYYAVEAVPYTLAGGDVLRRLYAMRLFSGLLLLVTVSATWLLAGELFGRRRLLQLSAAGVAGFQPMATFMSTSVNPDGMLMAAWAVGLWLGVKILRGRLTLLNGCALAAASAAAALSKANGYLLVAATLAILLYALWRGRADAPRDVARIAAVAAVVMLVPVVTWLGIARATDRPAVNQVASTSGQTVSITSFPKDYFLSYLWQFYLPRPGFLNQLPGGISNEYGYDVLVKTGWATFGWKEVRLRDGVYRALAWASLLALLAAAAALVLRRVRLSLPVGLFLGLTSLGLLLALHWVEFTFVAQQGIGFMQGRYLLPLLPLAGCAGAAALTLLPGRFRGAAAGAGLAALVGLQVLCLATVLERYYA